MANLLDFQRLSNFVGGIVDRKMRAVTLSITSATGYLNTIVANAQAYATQALTAETSAAASAQDADGAASSALLVWNSFTSEYLGVLAADPTKSQLGNAISNYGFYIRNTDGHIRYAVITNGVLSWTDATVAVDPNSVVSALNGKFLSLSLTMNQSVTGPVQFQSITLVPRITSWTSQQATPAVDVNNLAATLQTNITNEVNRATLAESNILLQFSSGSNANGFWAKRPGIIEQWGMVVDLSTTVNNDERVVAVTFPTPMANNNYVVSLTPALNTATINADDWIQLIWSTKTVNGFSVQYQHPAGTTVTYYLDGFEWHAVDLTAAANVTYSTSASGYSGGSTTTGGGGACPEVSEPILLANDNHTGPGTSVEAGKIVIGDYVWTRHEHTGEWGAYPVIAVNHVISELWRAPGKKPLCSPSHQFINDDLSIQIMSDIGHHVSEGTVVQLEVKDAHTYVVAGELSHNKTTQQAQ